MGRKWLHNCSNCGKAFKCAVFGRKAHCAACAKSLAPDDPIEGEDQ